MLVTRKHDHVQALPQRTTRAEGARGEAEEGAGGLADTA
jgi:hypothetical protein